MLFFRCAVFAKASRSYMFMIICGVARDFRGVSTETTVWTYEQEGLKHRYQYQLQGFWHGAISYQPLSIIAAEILDSPPKVWAPAAEFYIISCVILARSAQYARVSRARRSRRSINVNTSTQSLTAHRLRVWNLDFRRSSLLGGDSKYYTPSTIHGVRFVFVTMHR